jgi:hypothetical protein
LHHGTCDTSVLAPTLRRERERERAPILFRALSTQYPPRARRDVVTRCDVDTRQHVFAFVLWRRNDIALLASPVLNVPCPQCRAGDEGARAWRTDFDDVKSQFPKRGAERVCTKFLFATFPEPGSRMSLSFREPCSPAPDITARSGTKGAVTRDGHAREAGRRARRREMLYNKRVARQLYVSPITTSAVGPCFRVRER